MREERRVLRRVAKRMCYQCDQDKPFVVGRGKGRYYIHLRGVRTPSGGNMGTGLHPGDVCRCRHIWEEYEACGGVLREYDSRKTVQEQFECG